MGLRDKSQRGGSQSQVGMSGVVTESEGGAKEEGRTSKSTVSLMSLEATIVISSK